MYEADIVFSTQEVLLNDYYIITNRVENKT